LTIRTTDLFRMAPQSKGRGMMKFRILVVTL